MTNITEVTADITDTFLSANGIENINNMDNEQRADLADEIELAERGIEYLKRYSYSYQVDVSHIEIFNDIYEWPEVPELVESIGNNGIDMSSWLTSRILQIIGEKLG